MCLSRRSIVEVDVSRLIVMYELSQDLLDKQIELLERKYGGNARSNNAARVIQRTFRQYSMRRKFATITAMAKVDQRRLSRRFHSELIDSAWLTGGLNGSLNYTSSSDQPMVANDSLTWKEYVTHTNFAALVRELNAKGIRSFSRSGHNQYQHSFELTHDHHSHYSADRVTSPTSPPLPILAVDHGVVVTTADGSVLSVSSSPYDNNHHQNRHPHQNYSQVQSASSHGEICQSDSKTSIALADMSQRFPPETVRCTNSVLSTKLPLISHGSLDESPHPSHQQQHSQTPSLPDGARYPPMVDPAAERPTCNLSAEHSTSEDSLEGAGYSNIFWNENGGMGHHNHPVTTTSASIAVPFPSVQYDQLNDSAPQVVPATTPASQPTLVQAKVLESIRKRQYRVGLNLFNKKPEKGVTYLTQKGFLEASPRAVAKFFISRKGVSKQMIGEYLGNLQNPFNMATLDFFIEELDFAGLDIDVALRRFQTYFRMPGEAQKIERLMEVFGQRYCQCNPQIVTRLRTPDTVFILAFAVIMLNTDLHTPSIKTDKRMKLEDFIKNLRGIDDGANVDQDVLIGIYERVKVTEFKSGADHVTQVLKVQQSIVGEKPNLVLPHRRLVCYCRLYEVADAGRRERPGLHQREVFLFNDILVVTKIFSKKKNGVTYSFRQSFQLAGLNVSYFESHHYSFGIRLSQRVDGRTLVIFNARNVHDRAKFCEDLREAILEMDEMENLRIEGELEKQRTATRISRAPNPSTLPPAMVNGGGLLLLASCRSNRDSGVADMDHNGSVISLEETSIHLSQRPSSTKCQRSVVIRGTTSRSKATLKRTTLSNSLHDIHDPVERFQRRGSVGSLDSGMSISFQSSTTNSVISRDSSPKNLQLTSGSVSATEKLHKLPNQASFFGNIFQKTRERKNSLGTEMRYS